MGSSLFLQWSSKKSDARIIMFRKNDHRYQKSGVFYNLYLLFLLKHNRTSINWRVLRIDYGLVQIIVDIFASNGGKYWYLKACSWITNTFLPTGCFPEGDSGVNHFVVKYLISMALKFYSFLFSNKFKHPCTFFTLNTLKFQKIQTHLLCWGNQTIQVFRSEID